MMYGVWATVWLAIREFLGIAVEVKEAEDARRKAEADRLLEEAEKRQKEQEERDIREGKKKPPKPPIS